MNIEQLKYLVEVHKTLSITKAARNLFVSEPAISKSLRNLEKEFGIKLYKGTPSGIEFTKDGEEIVKQTIKVLYEFNEYKNNITNYINLSNNKIVGKLNIRVSPSLKQSIYPKIISNFLRKYPNVSIRTTELFDYDTYKPFAKNNFDLALVTWGEDKLANHPQLNLFNKQTISKLEVCIIMDSKHPLHNKRKITLDDISDYPWVATNSSGLEAVVDDHYFIKYSPSLVLWSDDINVVFETLIDTNYLASVTNLFRSHPMIKNKQLIIKPFENNFSISLGALYFKDSKNQDMIKLFLDSINLALLF